jgi:hypothetical protein
MSFALKNSFRYILSPLLFVGTMLWWGVHPRLFTFLPLLISLITLLIILFGRRPIKLFGGCLFFVLLTTWVPVDISLVDVPGPPRFIPMVYGLPTKEAMEEAERGKFYLGGCILGEVGWMLVW